MLFCSVFRQIKYKEKYPKQKYDYRHTVEKRYNTALPVKFTNCWRTCYAVSFAKQFLRDSDRGIADEHLFADVTEAWTVDMGDGIYGYHFWLTSTYNGIRMDTMPMKRGLVANYDDAQCTHSYDLHPGYALMIASDKLDSIMAFGFQHAYQIFTVIAICALGAVTCALQIPAQWCFPTSNMMIWLHYQELLRESVAPISGSFFYFIVCDLALLTATKLSYHNCE